MGCGDGTTFEGCKEDAPTRWISRCASGGLAVMSTLFRHNRYFYLHFYNNKYYDLLFWVVYLERVIFTNVFIPLKLRSNLGKDGMPT